MSSPFADWTDADWADYMTTYPKTRKVAPKVDPLLKKAIARTSMLLFLNELKPTKSPKKLAELKKSTLLLKKFIG